MGELCSPARSGLGTELVVLVVRGVMAAGWEVSTPAF